MFLAVLETVVAIKCACGYLCLCVQANFKCTEGSWDDVMRVIGQCHAQLHRNGIVRIQSDVRVGTRTDKVQGMKDKVDVVERLLKEGEGK
jgi:uncharacterized protein (TIGR00106 family)